MVARGQSRLACFVLPVRDDRLLLARHTYGYPEMWAMVGGGHTGFLLGAG